MHKLASSISSSAPSRHPAVPRKAVRVAAAQGGYLTNDHARRRWSEQDDTQQSSLSNTLHSASSVLITVAIVAALRAVYNRVLSRPSLPLRIRRGAHMDGSVRFSVATFNLRGVMDRWQERRPLLHECLKQLDADVLCFQEVLTGEFEQDRQLLDSSYHVFPCKAALFNLLTSGGLPRWYAQQVTSWLSLAPLQRLMVQLPPVVEAIRERYGLHQDLFRNIRDLTMAPFFGNSVACRLAAAHEINHSTLVLGDWRAAQRIEFSLGNANGGNGAETSGVGNGAVSSRGGTSSGRRRKAVGGTAGAAGAGAATPAAGAAAALGGGAGEPMKFWVVNTHLDHDHTDNRQRQALEVCRWMDQVKHDCAAIILCGDFNGAPYEAFHRALEARGYQSAYRVAHGSEPQGTWPTGIQAPLMDRGEFECLDFIYVWAADGYTVQVLAADLHGLEPAAHDKTLYPSDHAALRVELQIRRDPSALLPASIEVAATVKSVAAAGTGGKL
ncbi:hypothetical protein N2152v2_006943 [Parachlorella kessleri]